MMNNQIIGKITKKDGIKTFSMSLKEISLLCETDVGFKALWNKYKLRTSKEYIIKRFDELFFDRIIPMFIQKNKNVATLISVSYNAEGNITYYSHRDFTTDLLTAYKFAVLQNFDVEECLAYEFDYMLRGSQIRLLLPYGNLPQ